MKTIVWNYTAEEIPGLRICLAQELSDLRISLRLCSHLVYLQNGGVPCRNSVNAPHVWSWSMLRLRWCISKSINEVVFAAKIKLAAHALTHTRTCGAGGRNKAVKAALSAPCVVMVTTAKGHARRGKIRLYRVVQIINHNKLSINGIDLNRVYNKIAFFRQTEVPNKHYNIIT